MFEDFYLFIYLVIKLHIYINMFSYRNESCSLSNIQTEIIYNYTEYTSP